MDTHFQRRGGRDERHQDRSSTCADMARQHPMDEEEDQAMASPAEANEDLINDRVTMATGIRELWG